MEENTQFNYENEMEFSEKTYIDLMKIKVYKKEKRKILRRMITYFLLAIILFLPFIWKYTISAGVTIIFVIIFFSLIVIIYNKTGKIWRDTYKKSLYLHEKIRYGVNNEYFYIISTNIEQKIKWNLLSGWYIRGEYLQLICNGFAHVYLNINDMKSKGVYENVEYYLNLYGK